MVVLSPERIVHYLHVFQMQVSNTCTGSSLSAKGILICQLCHTQLMKLCVKLLPSVLLASAGKNCDICRLFISPPPQILIGLHCCQERSILIGCFGLSMTNEAGFNLLMSLNPVSFFDQFNTLWAYLQTKSLIKAIWFWFKNNLGREVSQCL